MFKKSATVEPIEVEAPERSKAWKEEGAPAGAPAAAPGSKVAQTAVVKYGAPDSPPEHNGEDLDDGSEDSDQIGFAKGRKEQLRRTDTMRFDPNDNLTFVQKMWMTLDEPSFSRGAAAPLPPAPGARALAAALTSLVRVWQPPFITLNCR